LTVKKRQSLNHSTTKNKYINKIKRKKKRRAGHQWLTPTILATQEAEIRRIAI
jgi:hypothetical protein